MSNNRNFPPCPTFSFFFVLHRMLCKLVFFSGRLDFKCFSLQRFSAHWILHSSLHIVHSVRFAPLQAFSLVFHNNRNYYVLLLLSWRVKTNEIAQPSCHINYLYRFFYFTRQLEIPSVLFTLKTLNCVKRFFYWINAIECENFITGGKKTAFGYIDFQRT